MTAGTVTAGPAAHRARDGVGTVQIHRRAALWTGPRGHAPILTSSTYKCHIHAGLDRENPGGGKPYAGGSVTAGGGGEGVPTSRVTGLVRT